MGSRLPFHLVVGWKRKYVVRNRVLDSQEDTLVNLYFGSIPLARGWPVKVRSGLEMPKAGWNAVRMMPVVH